MLKILLEKDKTETGSEIRDLLCYNLSFAKIEKREDRRYIVLFVEPEMNNKRKRYGKELAKIVRAVANTVAEYIILNKPKQFIEALCREKLSDKSVDVKAVGEKITSSVTSDIMLSIRRYRRHNWYTVLYRRIIENMLENGIFAASSFIRFRITDFQNNVILRATKQIERYSEEIRYMEFIAMLQHFVDRRRPKLYEMKISVEKDGYTLTDGNGEPLDFSIYESARKENIDKEDLLIGILLMAAPVRILVSADDAFFNTDLFSTISNIFGERIIVDYARSEN